MIQDNDKWLTVAELAAETKVPRNTVYAWQYRGLGPRAHRFGRHLRFARADVDAWYAEQAIRTSRV